MPATQGGPRLDETARKWRDLAERRLAYFTELYSSGRWKHYYTQESFALRMHDAIKAAKIWGDLADSTLAQSFLAEQSFAGKSRARDDRLRLAA